MVEQNSIGLTLYAATQNFRDKQQYDDSQVALMLIDILGLTERIRITYLNKLDSRQTHLGMIINPNKEIRLPFLEYINYQSMSGEIVGYSGLDEITEALASMGSAGIIAIHK